MIALDTNILIRYLTRDDEVRAERCLALLRQAEAGEQDLFLCEAILAEAVYVLSSPKLYNLGRAQVRNVLSAVVNLRGVHLPQKHVCRQALNLYAETNLDFEDALLVAHMRSGGMSQLYSYDRHFDDAGLSLERLEP